MAELACTKETRLEPTPTIGYNNLVTSPVDGQPVYIHNEDVVLIRALGPTRLAQSEASKAPVTSVAFLTARNRPLLCFTNRYGASAVDVARDTAILRIPTDHQSEARGIAVIEGPQGKLTIAVGCSSGAIFFHEINADFAVQATVQSPTHTSSISQLNGIANAGEGPALVSCDVDGTVCTHAASGQLVASATFAQDCATAAAPIGNGLIAAAFGSSTVQLLEASTCTLVVAIGAHSRWINAMSYSPVTNRLATASEDGLLCLWSMPTATDGSVGLVAFKAHDNALLTGAAFTPDGAAVVATAYDNETAWTYMVGGI